MISDSFFTMGSSHRVCQDYARHLAGWAALSDGCSSNEDTDMGARLVCMASSPLVEGWRDWNITDQSALQSLPHILHRASSLAQSLQLSASSVLCATLATISSEGPDTMWARVIGDGVRVQAAVRETSVEALITTYTATQDRPPYPIYQKTVDGWNDYLTFHQNAGTPPVLKTQHLFKDDQMVQVGEPTPLEWGDFVRWDTKEYNLGILFSDGITSIPGVPAEEMAARIVSRIRDTVHTPAFLQRCVKKALVGLAKPPFDDFSAAALWAR